MNQITLTNEQAKAIVDAAGSLGQIALLTGYQPVASVVDLVSVKEKIASVVKRGSNLSSTATFSFTDTELCAIAILGIDLATSSFIIYTTFLKQDKHETIKIFNQLMSGIVRGLSSALDAIDQQIA